MVAPKGALTGGAPPGVGDGRLCLTWEDFGAALRVVRPSALREVELRVPRVSWDDIGGQRALKTALTEAVQWPLRHPEAFERLGIRPPRGVLLYGPPGCSKTLAAKALASESRTNFLAVKGPELFSKYVGESERAVASLFRRARAAAPAIIFFDEIDALAAKRAEGAAGAGGVGARVLAQLLHEMDGVQPLSKVLVVAATNRPDLVDPALLRPGRFDALLYVGLPDLEGRLQILRIHTRAMPLADDVDLDGLAARTPNFSGAELAALCREAALAALEVSEAAAAVALEHFERALELVVPRTSPETLAYFSRYEAATRMGGAQAQTVNKQPQPPPPQQQQQQFVWPGK
jgi:AAA family ATPase